MAPKRHKAQSQSVTIATNSQHLNCSTVSSDDQGDDETEILENDVQLKQMVSASVQYILIHHSKGQLLKRLDWINTVLRPMANNARKYFSQVDKSVVKALQETFGYRLVYIDKQDGYCLVNDLKQGPLENRPLANGNQYSKYALLMIIVACMRRAGGEMNSTDFWTILSETLGIRQDESTRLTINQHKYFGDVQKLIKTDYVREGYLVFEQMKDFTGDGPSPQTVKLGWRTDQEFPDHALEQFIDKINHYEVDED